MNKSKTKKSFSYRDLLYKALIFIGTVAIIVYFLPRDGKFNYQFDIDKPWKYGQLMATFDFPIYKDDAVVKREQQQQALAQLTIDVKEKCDYRRAAVLKSYQFRKEDLLTRIEAVDDESIKRMYTSQLNSLETEKNSSLNDLENIQNCAAVEENVIVRGIITVCD